MMKIAEKRVMLNQIDMDWRNHLQAMDNLKSPEGCASILWRDPSKVQLAADSLNLTAKHCEKFGIIDEVISELPGGAHRNYHKTIESVGNSISNNLKQLMDIEKSQLVSSRNNKFLNITSNIL